MQFTILLSLLALTASIIAAPVPEAQLGTASNIVGIGCSAFEGQCGKVGEAAIDLVKDIGAQREKTVEQNGAVPVALTDTLAG
ncbi:hypothetical protein TWF506_002992 [Arthrobotrys conoides]|uniref:Uncharacterized protein n=1 Tax=Arthrobotrys conoides TaxID=74498 RepID=A0AAN8NC23_9PEZI